MSKIAIIGLGNTLRRDDGIGIHLLSELKERFKTSSISFLNFGIASFGLINYIGDFNKVLLLDAIDANLNPAELRIFGLNEAQFNTSDNKVSSHELSLSDICNLYKTMELKSDVRIAGVQVKDTSFGLEMTPELENAKAELLNKISDFVSSWSCS